MSNTFSTELPIDCGYDLIGDIHGCLHTLESLLDSLGYQKRKGVYSHATRKVVFLGDFIDRGRHIREVIHLVRAMIAAGHAYTVIGNHEYNAIAWSTPVEAGGETLYLRGHTPRHYKVLKETLTQFEEYPEEWEETIEWFKQMPIYLQNEKFRVVHACWDDEIISGLKEMQINNFADRSFLLESVQNNSLAWWAADRLLRGTWLLLPNGEVMEGKDGFKRRAYRTKFWFQQASTHGELAYQPDPLPENIANMEITEAERERVIYYGASQPLLFIGHYWQQGTPKRITENIACLDYSAVKQGQLVAYRLDNERQLMDEKFVWVGVDKRDLMT